MSDEINSNYKSSTSEIYNVANDIGLLYLRDDLSDLTLVVNNRRFPVHKVILGARCDYFKALLYGGLRESYENEIQLKEDASAEAIECILKFIYKGCINVLEMNEKLILDTLSLAHKYGLSSVERLLSAHLASGLDMNNVVTIFNIAVLYEIKTLMTSSLRYLDKHATEILQSDKVSHFSQHALVRLISRDSFYAPEIKIFEAVKNWLIMSGKDSYESAKDILDKTVRFELIPLNDLLETVRESGIVEPNRILDVIQATFADKSNDKVSLSHRGLLIPEEDLANDKWGFSVICGKLSGNNYNLNDKACSRQPRDILIIKLGNPSKINKVCLQLNDHSIRDVRTRFEIKPYRDTQCSCWLGGYTLESSMDMNSWQLLVDYQKFCCSSWQTLYFEPHVVQYLRVRGCRAPIHERIVHPDVSSSSLFNNDIIEFPHYLETNDSTFNLLSIKCMYTETPSQILYQTPDKTYSKYGLIMPNFNVCLLEHHATVIEGVSRTSNSLLNGDCQNYNWDTGYTCHQLGNGSIVVQLAQPYWINCIRFLLWDLDSRVYSYKVEVSVDGSCWTMVAERSMCSSMQTLMFASRPIVFIRITGTYNSVNEVFHVVHLEAYYTNEEDQIEDNSPAAMRTVPQVVSLNNSSPILPDPSPPHSLSDRMPTLRTTGAVVLLPLHRQLSQSIGFSGDENDDNIDVEHGGDNDDTN